MNSDKKKLHKPAIVISESDHERLSRLADSISHTNEQAAEELYAELERARIVGDEKVPAAVIRMGSTLRFTTSTGEDRRVTLSFPDKADIAEGKVSILSRIGTALIGLKQGQSIEWRTRDERVSRLTVEEVEPFVPESAKSEKAG